MVDFFLLLMLAGAGDELQGIKRGIIEMANAIIINKADGDNMQKANLAKQQYANALHLLPPTESGWIPAVDTCSALSKDGVENVWKIISDYQNLTKKTGFFWNNRKKQELKIMFETINYSLRVDFKINKSVKNILPKIEEKVLTGKMSSYKAAQELLSEYFKNIGDKY